jgi:starch phosphorylase
VDLDCFVSWLNPFSDHFSRNEPGIFDPSRDVSLTQSDHYMHLADPKSNLESDERPRALYGNTDEWACKATVNVAGSRKFFSGRTKGSLRSRDLECATMFGRVQAARYAWL